MQRDFLALERRRQWAARLLKQGVHQSEAARQVGVHRQSVSRWAQQLKAAGLSGLKKAGRAGRKPRLSAQRPDAGSAVPLQLEDLVSDGRRDLVEFLLSPISWQHSQSAGGGVSFPSAAAHSRQAVSGLGRIVGPSGHRGRLVWDFVREQRGRIWLEFLPAYAPELNPVEYLWSHWKHHELPNFCPKTFGELSHYARKALRRMRRRPTLVAVFWQQANLFH